MLLHGSQQSLHFYSFFFVFVFISVLFIIFYAFFLLFTSFCSLSFTGKQDILAPDQPYEGNYGQGPSSVHSNQDGGRSYRQGIVFSPLTHFCTSTSTLVPVISHYRICDIVFYCVTYSENYFKRIIFGYVKGELENRIRSKVKFKASYREYLLFELSLYQMVN